MKCMLLNIYTVVIATVPQVCYPKTLNLSCACTTAPEVPTIELATSKQSDRITVEFEEVSGAASYVMRAEAADGTYFSETSASSSPETIQGLQPYTEYSVSVLAVNTLGGQSQPSVPVLAKTGTVLVKPVHTNHVNYKYSQRAVAHNFFLNTVSTMNMHTNTFTLHYIIFIYIRIIY